MFDDFINDIQKEAGTKPKLTVNIHKSHRRPIPIEQAHRIAERIAKKYKIKGKANLSYYPKREYMAEYAVAHIGTRLSLFFKPKRRTRNV